LAARHRRSASFRRHLVRATTAGTFYAAGARVEAMYAPEVNGRSAGTTITVK
jgi:uncharacterized protein YfaS (alpha-2-macroglobulin family)